MKKHIEVVAAVIKSGDTYFAAQRNNKGELALKWEFPGGKIEKGETNEEALIRELKEELEITVDVIKHIKTVYHEYKTFNLTLHAYKCNLRSDTINLKEHLDSKWLTKDKLFDVDWAEADIPVVEILRGD